MDFLANAHKFGELSTAYREAVVNNQPEEKKKQLNEIKFLISSTVNQINTVFNLKLEKRVSVIQTKKGIPLFPMSAQKIVAKGLNLTMRDITTLNPQGKKLTNGVVFFLDYSGSMWFREQDKKGSTISQNDKDVLRIYAQNFLVLVMAFFMEQQQKKVDILFNFFGEHNVQLFTKSMHSLDLDTFLVHGDLQDQSRDAQKQYSPLAIQEFGREMYDGSNALPKAIEETKTFFKGKNLKNFTVLFFTDGGLGHNAFSKEQREKFVVDCFNNIQSQKERYLFTFIKEQSTDTAKKFIEAGYKACIFNDVAQYNDCFMQYSNFLK